MQRELSLSGNKVQLNRNGVPSQNPLRSRPGFEPKPLKPTKEPMAAPFHFLIADRGERPTEPFRKSCTPSSNHEPSAQTDLALDAHRAFISENFAEKLRIGEICNSSLETSSFSQGAPSILLPERAGKLEFRQRPEKPRIKGTAGQ